ncbi:hypothetical protein FGE12_09025 [Aggregicoccus sp. 17bor-14]|uniref:NADase-type glycan-binding domain-containing protein n=1 Tax=Myxococcaceae TaxID=31 RepID=UPI00129CD823|nr:MULTISPECIES: hypothetical protein [Myxococcaceae]MBF5042542.1 hypothetical protein [Simulacricoccus sp. 17bor-14]MRI88312.1 hypothetical protein [Aggregicoccus sp. 17bor-14]
MASSLPTFPLALLLASAPVAAAPPRAASVPSAAPSAAVRAPAGVGYAQVRDYYQREEKPGRYGVLNLLDGRELSAWCTPGPDTLDVPVTVGFKDSVTLDEVRVFTGNGADEKSFQGTSRAREFSLESANGARRFSVADQRGLQTVQLNPPLSGARFTLWVLDQYPSQDPEAPVCVTDVVFVSQGKALNGPWLAPRLKPDARVAPLLGTWFAGYDGAPDRFLSFYFDGTFRYVAEPFEDAAGKRNVVGSYAVSGTHLTLELPKRGKVRLALRREAREGGGEQLRLDGTAPEGLEALREPFRSQP